MDYGRIAPLKRSTGHCGRKYSWWFTETAVTAKQKRRRLERRWSRRTRRDEDHVTYMSACRETNTEIN